MKKSFIMAIISTQEGVFKWLVNHGFVGKKRHNKNKVDLIIKEYKKATGNEFHYWNFYPHEQGSKRWNKSRDEFAAFVSYMLNSDQNVQGSVATEDHSSK